MKKKENDTFTLELDLQPTEIDVDVHSVYENNDGTTNGASYSYYFLDYQIFNICATQEDTLKECEYRFKLNPFYGLYAHDGNDNIRINAHCIGKPSGGVKLRKVILGVGSKIQAIDSSLEEMLDMSKLPSTPEIFPTAVIIDATSITNNESVYDISVWTYPVTQMRFTATGHLTKKVTSRIVPKDDSFIIDAREFMQ